MSERILVNGAGGFIGGHLIARLKKDGHWVRGVDIKSHEFSDVPADEFILGDLRDPLLAMEVCQGVDTVYQLAADMGGAGYIFTGKNDAAIMHNSAMINLNTVHAAVAGGVKKMFYSSSACIYPESNQLDPDNPNCEESSAYPAAPDSEYGWEKLFSERLYLTFARTHRFQMHIARFHNVFGPAGTWDGGREKAPAAVCRKIAQAAAYDSIEIWGDGRQTRSFLYIDECIEGILRLTDSNFTGPVNIGSSEMVTIDRLVEMVAEIAGKQIDIQHIAGPTGVRGRCSDNRLIRQHLGWRPSRSLYEGLEKTYAWVEEQVCKRQQTAAVEAKKLSAQPLELKKKLLLK